MANISDSMNLVMIKSSPGAVCLRIRGQSLWAIFDREYQAVAMGQIEIESRDPALTCRTSDVERIEVVKDDAVDGLPEPFRVIRHQPDGTGISVVVLKK